MPDEPLSDDAVTAAREMRVLFGRLRRRLHEVADDDLTPSQASALSRLAKGEVSTASGLAALEGVRPQSMAATLAPLEQRGLVHREPDPDDGRRQLVLLTDAGRERAEGTRRSREEWLARAFQDRFDDDERRTVVAALGLMDRVTQA